MKRTAALGRESPCFIHRLNKPVGVRRLFRFQFSLLLIPFFFFRQIFFSSEKINRPMNPAFCAMHAGKQSYGSPQSPRHHATGSTLTWQTADWSISITAVVIGSQGSVAAADWTAPGVAG